LAASRQGQRQLPEPRSKGPWGYLKKENDLLKEKADGESLLESRPRHAPPVSDFFAGLFPE